MNKCQRANGFTLIELIIVIVVLGVLATTAAPKLLNIQKDAQAGALEGLSAALSSSSEIVYAKALIEGVESSADTTLASGITAILTQRKRILKKP